MVVQREEPEDEPHAVGILFQWYVADPTTGTESEVALKASEVLAAQTDPNVFPTPDTSLSPAGPSWIQIGNESGFLPAPTIIPSQPITWITDPTRFDVGNVDKHSLLIAPAERADVIVDFSKYAGKTLILYNDSPAAFPARRASYDYYTGAPDLSPMGSPGTLPGYGPNTRTVMQVKIVGTPAAAFNYTALATAFKHKADGSGVFESGSAPIVVGQAAYNSAYGKSFIASGWCNNPINPTAKCDGFARINEQSGETFKFDTLLGAQLGVKIEPKAIHDETNAVTADPYGRMMASLGVEAMPANPVAQNAILYPFINPATEIFDATNLPTTDTLTPIAVADDGTQIWKITHNGVDTHPIHFHLYDVQVLNRVTWDNIIIPPDANELGWKETVRVSPLEDTYFALRPVLPVLPWELPNSIRMLDPMMPAGDTTGFNNVDPAGNPTLTPITNQLVNYGSEYMLHCHMLSHEEMDMMRPVAFAIAPAKPDALEYVVAGSGRNTTLTLTWNDNSINETEFVVQRDNGAGVWQSIGTVRSPLDQPNTPGSKSFVDKTYRDNGIAYSYRVVAQNTVGLGGAFPSKSAKTISEPMLVSKTYVLTRFDQTDPNILYSGAWSTFSATGPWMGTYARTSAAAGSVTIAFQGRRLDLLATRSGAMGIADVSVDGGPVTKVDLAVGATLYADHVFTTGMLADGLHIVRITRDPASLTGKYINIDAVDLIGATVPFSRVEQTDAGLLYGGSWSTASAVSASAGSYARTSATGSTVTLAFDGIRLDVVAAKSSAQGIADISLDGGKPIKVDLSSTTALYAQTVFSTGALAAGYHTLSISWDPGNAAGKYINIDALDIMGNLVSVAKVEQTDPRLLYAGTWAPSSVATASGGSYSSSNTSGASVTIPFTGRELVLVAAKGPTMGKADVYLDGVFAKTVDLANATARDQMNVYDTGSLTYGLHSVTFTRNPTNTADKYINLDAVGVVGTLVSSVRYQQTDTHIVYGGNWNTFNTAPASGGSYARTNSGTATATINFVGVKLDWIASTGSALGKALVSVDGGAAVTVDLTSAPTLYQRNVWSSGLLPAGVHTVVISVSPSSPSGRFINIDALDVVGILQ